MNSLLVASRVGLVLILIAGCGDSDPIEDVAPGDSSNSAPSAPMPCGGSEPEGQCNAITECVWTSDTASACLQICESTDCTEDEECRTRVKRSSDGAFKVARVCLGKVEPAETPEAQADRTTFCAERPAEVCGRSPLCNAQLATLLVIEDRCKKLAATDCFPHYGLEPGPYGRICLPSSWLATREDSPGDIFSLGSICGQPGFEGYYPEPEDPVYEILNGEMPVFSWPPCF